MRITAILAIFLLWDCSLNDTKIVNGGGTDVSNARIIGQVLSKDSTPAASVVIRLYPKGTNPFLNLTKSYTKIYETKSDAQGHFEILVKDTGDFVLDCGNAINNEKAFVFGLRLTSDSQFRQEKVFLSKTGAIQIPIPLALREKDDLYAYIPGTSYFAHIDESKIIQDSLIVFEDLPAGLLPSIHFAAINDSELDEAHDLDIEIKEGDTTQIEH